MEQQEYTFVPESIDYIRKGLDDARKHGLEAEVVHFALLSMKNNSTLTIQNAFDEGCREWDV